MAERVPRAQAIRIIVAREAAQDQLGLMMAAELLAFFIRQGRNAARFVRTGKSKAFTDPDGLVPPSDVELLNRIIARYATAQWEFTSGVVAPLVDVAVSDVLNFEARRRLALRVTNINKVTRNRIANIVEDGVSRKLTDRQIGLEIGEAMGQPARGQMIARTELALADQQSAVDRYRAGGVEVVEVFDGPGCGWTSHDDPDIANGSVRTLDQAETQPLSHPNCRRAFLPVTDVVVPDTAEELAEWQQAQQEEWESEGLI